MSLLTTFRGAVPFLRRSPAPLPRTDMLALRPMRNPAVTWEAAGAGDADDAPLGVVLTVPRRDDGWGKVLARWLQLPGGKRIELDEFGAQVWGMCDGTHTVEQLVQYTCAVYNLNRRQGEISVVAFMRMLTQRRLVGFPVKEKGVTHGGADSGTGPRGRANRRRPKRAGAARRR